MRHFMYVNNSINWHWTTALSAIESKEPTLATVVAVVDAKSARVEDTYGCIFVFLLKGAVLCKKGRQKKNKLTHQWKI